MIGGQKMSRIQAFLVRYNIGVVRAALLASLWFGSCFAGQPPALAQGEERFVVPPPRAQILRSRPGVLPSPFVIGGEARLEFDVVYTDGTIFNPGTNQNDLVRLRSYRDAHERARPGVPFVAPTIEIAPGETVRITLNNKLPKNDPSCPAPPHDVNQPHCFNRTNLHSHGLWVSPTGNSDNVLLGINPSVSFEYEYNVPSDHPAGTFWYHPHRHGSTAIQVSSGMAGLLIVKGERLPTPESTGDVDTLLRETGGAAFVQRLVLLQQIQYACRDTNGRIQQGDDGQYFCNPGQVGGIENYDQFGPTTWHNSGRHTTINGEVTPVFAGAQVGRIEHWRIAHAGVRDTILLQFKKMRPGAPSLDQLTATQRTDWVTQNCSDDVLAHFALASDGLTRAQIAQRTTTVLQPGYREDLLVVFQEAGDYCVIDDGAGPSSTVNAQTKGRSFLGRVSVGIGQPVDTDIKSYLQSQLMAAADRTMPTAVRQIVRDDLANDLRLTSFVPHPEITDSEVKGKQRLQLKIDTGSRPPEFLIDGAPYDPNRIDRTLSLGGVDEWTLTSWNNPPAGHPFHIHVNPFQVVKILDPDGNDVSITGEVDDPQYANLKGVWKDTIFVKPNYQIVMRTRYRRYIGDFVLHCHILDHEDQGMMQNIRIAIPDGAGGVLVGHH
jgi:FtsP/CotA-like multicopper oxidase with cupredoxin domain